MAGDLKIGEMILDVRARTVKMESELNRLRLDVDKKTDQMANDFRKVEHSGKMAFGRTRSAAEALKGTLGAIGITIGIQQVIRGFFSAVNAATALGESINAVNVVFGEGTERIKQFGKNAAASVGLANSEFNQLATVTGALLKDVGKPMEEVADITIDLTKRAADLASVFNTPVQDALGAINAAIRGEGEAIRRYTGDVTDNTLQQFALSNGIQQSVSAMSEQEKRLLRVEVLMWQTSFAAGDFDRTSGELTNQQRILSGHLENTAAALGELLIPRLNEMLTAVNAFFKSEGVTKLIGWLKRLDRAAEFILLGKPKMAFDALRDSTIGMTQAQKARIGLYGEEARRLQLLIDEVEAFGTATREQSDKIKLRDKEKLAAPGNISPRAPSAPRVSIFTPEMQAEIAKFEEELALLNLLGAGLEDTFAQIPISTEASAQAAHALWEESMLVNESFLRSNDAIVSAVAQTATLDEAAALLGITVEELAGRWTKISEEQQKVNDFLNQGAGALGSILGQGVKLEKIFARIAALAIATFIGGPFGAFFSGLIGGLAGKEGGHFEASPSGKLRKTGAFAQTGANFMVPARFSNDSYPLWVGASEHVRVTPAGKVGDEARQLAGLHGQLAAMNANLIKFARRQDPIFVEQSISDLELVVTVEKGQQRKARYQ